MIVVADLGSSNTDLLLADADGEIVGSAVRPAVLPAAGDAFLHEISAPLAVAPERVHLIAVTGGRHRLLPERIAGVPLCHVDEIAAISRGGLAAGGVERAVIVSMGTGTALVVADGEQGRHAGGVALGGGTLRGLSARLLGTTDPARIAALALRGDPRGVDYTVADITAGGIGILPGTMPAAYLARLADESGTREDEPADIAAGLLDMIGHIAMHMGMLTARIAGLDTLVFTGHMVEYAGVRRAIRRLEGRYEGRIIIPPEPGLAVARGALLVALADARRL
jgi:type II pantothenate kinase